MRIASAFFCFLLSLSCHSVYSQKIRTMNSYISETLNTQGSSHELFKLSLLSSVKKGTSVGFSFGMWKEYPVLQYSLNTGFMWRFGKGFLGNYRNGYQPDDNRTKGQLVFMFSPMLTTRLSNKDFVYQELEPFYLGTPNAVFSKFRHSLTLGTTFTISPRGTYKNVSTIRNRAQQDFLFSLNLKQFNFTLYDDYFPVFTDVLQLGDNWDRFFTGGGFVRYRFSDEVMMHVYSEVYTGINRSNAFLYPDIISYKNTKRGWRQKNYANQDPGQEYFNASWLIASLTYTNRKPVNNNQGIYLPDIRVFAGTSGSWTMFSQNIIHDKISYDKDNKMQLHYFLPRTNVPGNLEAGGSSRLRTLLNSSFLGAGTSYNFIKP